MKENTTHLQPVLHSAWPCKCLMDWCNVTQREASNISTATVYTCLWDSSERADTACTEDWWDVFASGWFPLTAIVNVYSSAPMPLYSHRVLKTWPKNRSECRLHGSVTHPLSIFWLNKRLAFMAAISRWTHDGGQLLFLGKWDGSVTASCCLAADWKCHKSLSGYIWWLWATVLSNILYNEVTWLNPRGPAHSNVLTLTITGHQLLLSPSWIDESCPCSNDLYLPTPPLGLIYYSV